MNTQTKVGAAVAAALLVVGITYAVVPSPATCQPDPSVAIAALPSGGTFTGTGCYNVPNGIRITQPVTINGGIYNDPSTTGAVGVGYGGIQPVISIRDTHNVTLKNLSIVGGNPDGGYHSSQVGQTGIRVLSSDHVTIANVRTSNTFGDGLTLFADLPKNKNPVSNLVVSNLTVTHAGRQGVTTAALSNAVLTNVNVVSAAAVGLDAESDLTGIGMGHVTFNHLTAKGINLIDFLTGPIVFNNSVMSGHVVIGKASTFPITVNHGTLTLPSSSHGYPPAGIYMPHGGNLTFAGTAVTRPLPNYGQPAGLTWQLMEGAHLTFVGTPAPTPPGTNDATSTVTVTP